MISLKGNRGESIVEFKFSLVDDESELVIGYYKNVTGLNGKELCIINNEVYNKLTLIDFCFNDAFKKYYKETYVNNLYISILNKNEQPIASYYFYLYKPLSFYNNEIQGNTSSIELIGTLTQIASDEAIELWDLWREKIPVNKNEWTDLSEKKRRGWLEVVKLYNSQVKSRHEEKVNQTINLDGSYITDYYSFFCALGEAINGPGGYFGDDFSSLRDCFCGGFGAVPPFTLIWSKSHIAMKKLDKEAWIRDILYKRKIMPTDLGENILLEKGDKPLFNKILEVFKEENVNVILEN